MFAKLKQPLALLVGGLLLLMVGFSFGTAVQPGLASSSTAPVQQDITSLNEVERLFSEIYNTVSPSVVAISTSMSTESGFIPEGSGSGFIMDRQGHIVTNFHVVAGADRIVVNMFDGTIVEAQLIGDDPDSDLAVIRVDLPADRLQPVPLADSNNLVVGQTVLAIGNPFSRDWTLTSGIVSALNRTIEGLDTNRYSIGGVIQHDAAINPGNSGGPLVNLNGEVIGVNSQIEIRDGVRLNAGVGFAIPSTLVNRVAQSLIATGRMEYSYMGISSLPIDIDLIDQYDLPNNIRGVAVRQVLGEPARLAGLETITFDSVDIITAIDNIPIGNFDDLVGYLSINTSPGQTVNLSVYRGGQTVQIPLTLGTRR